MLCRRYKIVCFFSFTRTQRIVGEMNEDLLGVRNWCFRNRLLLNPDKTKLIVFGSRQKTSRLHEFRLSLSVKDISPVQSAKDLDHIKTTVSECIARLAQIDRTSLLTAINAILDWAWLSKDVRSIAPYFCCTLPCVPLFYMEFSSPLSSLF